MQKTKKLLLIGTAAIIIASMLAVMPKSVATAATNTWYVDGELGNDGNEGTESFPFKTINKGIGIASGGDTVLVAAGTYAPSTNDEVFPINMKDGVSLVGSGADTILAAENNNRVIHCVLIGSTTRIEGFTITKDSASSYGGGMYNYLSSPTVTNCIFTGNSAYNGRGSGMYNEGSSPTVTNCSFTGNWAYDSEGQGWGGGMYNKGSSPIVTNCIFTENWARHGGGICNEGSSPAVTNCTFTENYAYSGRGGGMYNEKSSPTVTNCIFTANNTAIKSASGYGGGMCNSTNSSPTVTNCTFTGNSTSGGNGGGMYNEGSSPTVTNCTFTENSAYPGWGGGMYNQPFQSFQSSPTVTNCIFTGNWAHYGAGMYNKESSPAVTNCTFTENTAYQGRGGGMYNEESSPAVTNSTFSGNSADYGSGMYNDGSYISGSSSRPVTNCIFTENWARYGGGMYNEGSSPTVMNCTFTGNSADDYGGGMYNEESSPTVTNCILWGDTALGGSEVYNSSSSTPTFSYCDIAGSGGIGELFWDLSFGEDGGGNIDADPLFVSPADSDYHLRSDSPCKDRGIIIVGAPPDDYDYDGVPRPQGPAPDVGAYELICVKLDTNPTGLKVYVDPDPTPQHLTAPQYFYFVYDSTHTLGVETPQNIELIEYAFDQWDDAVATPERIETLNLFLITESESIFQANFRETALNNPPMVTAPPDVTAEATGAQTSVNIGTATATDEVGVVSITSDAPATFEVGTTIVTWTATDAAGNAGTATQSVTVEDTTAPELSVMPNTTTLWPPNHKYVTVSIRITASDICDTDVANKVQLVSVTSDEPEDVAGKNNKQDGGDGKTTDDIDIVDKNTVKLRAERLGGGDGRVYTLNYSVTDASGNTTMASTTVTVPHNPAKPAVDSGVKYTVTH